MRPAGRRAAAALALAALAAHGAQAQSPTPATESTTSAAPATPPAQTAQPAAPTTPAAPAAPAAETAAPAAEAPPTVTEGTTAGGLQEIVITATRHQEVMSRVPVSVSAYSQETMDVLGVKDFNDIARYTPGVAIDSNGSNNIAIRGISSSGGSGTTGIYIDDTPIQMRALGFNADDTLPKTFDLERVEVLRGPQGTLFGSGSEGGTVRYIMAQPNLHEASTYARTELSFTEGGSPSYEAGIAQGIPLVDGTLGVRASIWYRHDGGWIDQINPFTLQEVAHDSNYSNDVAFRVAAKWAVNDAWTITPSFIYQDRDVNAVTAYWPIYSNPGSNIYKNADPDTRPEPDHYWLPAVKIETQLGDAASLISNTSYFARKDLSGYIGTSYNLSYYQTFNWLTPQNLFNSQSDYPLIDGSGLHLPAALQNYRAPATVTNEQDDFTEELRLQSSDQENSRFTWTTGIFFAANRQISVEQINDPMMYQLFGGLFNANAALADIAANGLTCNYTPGASKAVLQEEEVYCANGATVLEPLLTTQPYYLMQVGDSYYNYNFSRDKQVAIFGETSLKITDKLKGIVGARYARTNVNFNHLADGPQNFIGANPGTGSESDNPFTPKLGLSYQADRNDLYYATWAKGFRIGGANPPIPTAACEPDLELFGFPAGLGTPADYKADTVKSFEIGTKNNVHDQFRIASSLYMIHWDDIQQNVYLPGCGFQFTTNVGKALSKGGDLQLDWVPNETWTFESAIGFTDARFTEDASLYPGGTPVVASGDAVTGESGIPPAPWTITLGAQYNFNAFDQKSYIRVDWEHESRNNTSTAAEDPRTGQFAQFAYTPAATTFVSLRAGTQVDRHWNVSAFIDNLLDSRPVFPPSSYPYSDIDEYAPYYNAATGRTSESSLIREYTFRPRTLGLTGIYRF